MQRRFKDFALAALIAVVPALALANNQEMADQIADRLRDSGQLSEYKIAVKYQDGTAWLRGQVSDEKQMNTALKLAFQTQGVTRVVNELSVDPAETAAAPRKSTRLEKAGAMRRWESLASRGAEQESSDDAQRVSSSSRAMPVSMVSVEEPQDAAPQQMTAPQRTRPLAPARMVMAQAGLRGPTAANGGPLPMYTAAANPSGAAPARYDQPCMPNYAWPSYAAYPNYAAVTYPKQYSPTAWPYIGPFYPYPQVPLGWRKVTLEWDDGWWFLDFKDQPASCWHK